MCFVCTEGNTDNCGLCISGVFYRADRITKQIQLSKACEAEGRLPLPVNLCPYAFPLERGQQRNMHIYNPMALFPLAFNNTCSAWALCLLICCLIFRRLHLVKFLSYIYNKCNFNLERESVAHCIKGYRCLNGDA